jgi:hypothetical protein
MNPASQGDGVAFVFNTELLTGVRSKHSVCPSDKKFGEVVILAQPPQCDLAKIRMNFSIKIVNGKGVALQPAILNLPSWKLDNHM